MVNSYVMKIFLSALFTQVIYLGVYSQNIGIGTTTPTDKLHIASAVGEDALRVQVGGITKLRVWNNGGVSIGSFVQPPVNGLYINGPLQPQNGIETSNKLVIESTGDSIILNAGASQIIIAANGNIIIKAASNSITIDAGGTLNLKGSTINIDATANLNLSASVLNLGGQVINQAAVSQLNFSSSLHTQTASTEIRINAPATRFNNGGRGVARISDATSGNMATQTIVTASNKVFLD
jgi:hypothetical protein